MNSMNSMYSMSWMVGDVRTGRGSMGMEESTLLVHTFFAREHGRHVKGSAEQTREEMAVSLTE